MKINEWLVNGEERRSQPEYHIVNISQFAHKPPLIRTGEYKKF